MKRFSRIFFSWKLIVSSTVVVAALVLCSVAFTGLRPFALFFGFALGIIHLMISAGLWRAYMYSGVDYDSDDAYIPSGMSKSYYMLASFLVLFALSLAVTIIQREGSLDVIFNG